MRVSLQSFGGFAATVGHPAREVDAADLTPQRAAELARLVDQAAREPSPGDAGAPPDAMSYSITVEGGGRSTVLEQSDGAMTPGFMALLDWMRQNAR